jgi:hypothetical protein
MNDPSTYFITWTTYGTWLPGDTRGWRKTKQGDQPPQPLLEAWCRNRMTEFLDAETKELDALTAEAERAIELLQERRTALIFAAVTGKIDVRGLVATEVAS